MNTAQERLQEALAAEREAMEVLLAGRPAADALRRARLAYLESYADAKPGSWGRLIGALKCALLARDGDAVHEVATRAAAEADGADSAAAAYLRALAATALGQASDPNDLARLDAEGEAFGRTGRALTALAAGDGDAYAAALDEVIADFRARERYLAAPIADTAVVLERLAERRGLAVRPSGALLPPAA